MTSVEWAKEDIKAELVGFAVWITTTLLILDGHLERWPLREDYGYPFPNIIISYIENTPIKIILIQWTLSQINWVDAMVGCAPKTKILDFSNNTSPDATNLYNINICWSLGYMCYISKKISGLIYCCWNYIVLFVILINYMV